MSGAAGLIYEIVWSRQLTLFVGITTYAHTAVITAYMLGLALGSLVIGHISDKYSSPLRLFAWLEVAIALYAAATPWLVSWFQIVYAQAAGVVGVTGLSSHLVRFVIVLLLLLPATFLMGGTLPVMIKGMTGKLPELAESSGRWYGINTLGAVIGTVLAGYFLLPLIGVRNTLFVGVVLDLLVAGIVFATRGKGQLVEKNVAAPKTKPQNVKGSRSILVLFALSGFSALAYQIAWIRSLTLVLGSSVYSFTTTLTAFLVGIALGSLAYPLLPGGKNGAGQLGQAAIVTTLTGFFSLIGLFVIGRLPHVFLWGFQQGWGSHFSVFQLFMFGMCFAVMIVPTFLLGTLFPLMASLWTRQYHSIGKDIGVVYAANTTGCIFGATLAGLLFLPVLGVHGTVILAGSIHVVVGAGFLWKKIIVGRLPAARILYVVAAGLVFSAVSIAMPEWDRKIMTSGVFNYAAKSRSVGAKKFLNDRSKARDMLYYKDGLDGTVSVLEDRRQRLLVINGKIDATSVHDLPTQMMIGQLPMLIHPNPKSVLIVGLGSGITAGSIARHKSVETIDILEISPEVIEASQYFTDENNSILEDPRVNLIVADARNFLLATDRTYDVIASQPSNPWISGVANLFTSDFFELMQSRLAPRGIATQWFHIYNMTPDDTRSVLHSYCDVFAHASVWQSMNSDLIMIGSAQPHRLDADRVNDVISDPGLYEEMASINMSSLSKIARMFLISDASLSDYCEASPFNTDDRPRVEFHAPRNLYFGTTEKTLSSIFKHLAVHPSDFPVANVARMRDNTIYLPGFGLTVHPGRAITENNWVADYNVWRDIIDSSDQHPEMVGVGSRAQLHWQDNETTNRLFVFNVEAEPSMEQLAAYMQSQITASPLAGGEVDLPGGSRGVWVLTRTEGSPTMNYAMTWAVPSLSGEGYLHFAANRGGLYEGEEKWGPLLIDFAKSFVPVASSEE